VGRWVACYDIGDEIRSFRPSSEGAEVPLVPILAPTVEVVRVRSMLTCSVARRNDGDGTRGIVWWRRSWPRSIVASVCSSCCEGRRG